MTSPGCRGLMHVCVVVYSSVDESCQGKCQGRPPNFEYDILLYYIIPARHFPLAALHVSGFSTEARLLAGHLSHFAT